MATLKELTERITKLEQQLAAPKQPSALIAGSLLQIDHLRVLGEQNLIKIYTETKRVKNASKTTPGEWEVDYSSQGFTKIYTVFAVFQGFSIYPNLDNPLFNNWSHSSITDHIPQHVFVRVDDPNIENSMKAKGVAYCSESGSTPNIIDDNTVLFTVVVIGMGNEIG